MSISNYVISVIRTVVPAAAAGLITWLASEFTFVQTILESLNEETLLGFYGGLTVVVLGAYYALVRKLEQRWPWLGKLLGWQAKPIYVEQGQAVKTIPGGEIVTPDNGPVTN